MTALPNPMGLYILDADGNPVPEPDTMIWAKWLGAADRHAAHDELADGHVVSTIFLGIDHGFGDPRPILYETMVFNDYGPLDTDWACQRYATRAEALDGHAHALTELRLYLQTREVLNDCG